MLNNKDADGVLSTLMPLGNKLIFTRPNNPKAVDPIQLSGQVEYFGKEVYTIDTIPEAIETAMSLTGLDEILVITGSLYLVGDAKATIVQLLEHKKEAS